MPPSIVIQNKKIRKLFDQRINYYLQKKAMDLSNTTDPDIEKKNRRQGYAGELSVKTALYLFLSKRFTVINNLVLEVRPNDFIEIDHLVLSSNGIFVLETKTWSGEYDLTLSGWKKKGNNRPFKTNPFIQNQRHVDLLKVWIKDNFSNAEYSEVESCIYPLVVLKKGRVGKNEVNHTMPTRNSGYAAANYIKDTPGQNISLPLTRKIVDKIKKATPLDHWKWMHNHYTFKDVRVIRIEGPKERAEEIRKIYYKKGYTSTPVQQIEGQDAHSFTINNHLTMELQNEEKILQALKIRHVVAELTKPIDLSWAKKLLSIALILFILITGGNYILTTLSKADFSNFMDRSESPAPNSDLPLRLVVDSNVTYLYLKDGKKVLIDGRFKSGTEVHFSSDRTVKLITPGKDAKIFTVQNDIVQLEVGNSYTSIYHNEMRQKHLKYFKYNFKTNEILK
jgi:hypothetical protein